MSAYFIQQELLTEELFCAVGKPSPNLWKPVSSVRYICSYKHIHFRGHKNSGSARFGIISSGIFKLLTWIGLWEGFQNCTRDWKLFTIVQFGMIRNFYHYLGTYIIFRDTSDIQLLIWNALLFVNQIVCHKWNLTPII